MFKSLVFEMTEKDKMPYGEDFKVVLKVTNKGHSDRNIEGSVTVTSITYTGVPYKVIKKVFYTDQVVPASQSKYIFSYPIATKFFSSLFMVTLLMKSFINSTTQGTHDIFYERRHR